MKNRNASKRKQSKRGAGASKKVSQPVEPVALAPIAEYHERKITEARADAGKNCSGRPPVADADRSDAPVKKRRRFVVSISLEIDVDESLLASVLTDEWRGRFYDLQSSADVAEHLAFNLLCGCGSVGKLDGFADQPDDAAEIVRDSWWNTDETREV